MKLDRGDIREVFLANGFTIKPGETDLKPYVYDAADALLMLAGAGLKEAVETHCALVRELDVLLNGEEGAAKQASLCDIVAQVRREGIGADARRLRKLLQHCSEAKISYDRKTQAVSRIRMDFKDSVETSGGFRNTLRKTIDDMQETFDD